MLPVADTQKLFVLRIPNRDRFGSVHQEQVRTHCDRRDMDSRRRGPRRCEPPTGLWLQDEGSAPDLLPDDCFDEPLEEPVHVDRERGAEDGTLLVAERLLPDD